MRGIGKIGAYAAIGIVGFKWIKSTWNVLWGTATGGKVDKKDRSWMLGGL
jgi:hypothetical protein